jgi:hypothetical protein
MIIVTDGCEMSTGAKRVFAFDEACPEQRGHTTNENDPVVAKRVAFEEARATVWANASSRFLSWRGKMG